MIKGHLRQWLMTYVTIFACLSFVTIFLLPTANAASSTIEGQVWLDLNGDGRKVAPGFIADAGFGNVTVKAFDSTGASVSATTSAVAGNVGKYSLNLSTLNDGPFRVEMTIPTGYTSSAVGLGTDSTVRQSVAPGAKSVDFAIEDASTYCASNPRLVVSCFSNGDKSSGTTSTQASVKSFRFDDEGYPGLADYNVPQKVNSQSQTGTIYGLAYSRDTQKIYEGAFLRRHADVGPADLGAIYVVNSTTGAVEKTITVPGAGTESSDVGARDLSTTNGPSRDIGAFGKVGKVGLGDVDITPDGKTLFATNLKTKELVRITNLGAASPTIQSFPIPANVTCPVSDANRRVFGLGVRTVDGHVKVYVGVTCTGEAGGAIEGKVVEMDVDHLDTATVTLTIPFNYDKGCALVNEFTGPITWSGTLGCQWNKWSDNYLDAQAIRLPSPLDVLLFSQGIAQWGVANPQPLISDIQFDQTGSMVIGVADRGGWQWGHFNYAPTPAVGAENDRSREFHSAFSAGDQLRACPDSNGTFVLEDGGVCISEFAPQGQGIGGGEFYWGDSIYRTAPNVLGIPTETQKIGHDELGLGAFAFVPGRTQMAATITDPFFTLDHVTDFRSNSVGIAKLAHIDVKDAQGTVVQKAGGWYGTLEVGKLDEDSNSFAKSGGLGDLEVLCENAPVEIGNYVWLDADKDGIQDPNEVPLQGVSVSLTDKTSGAVVATAKTDAAGHYLFVSEGVGNVSASGWDGPDAGDDNPDDFVGIVKDPNGQLGDGLYGIKSNTDYIVKFNAATTNIAPLAGVGVTSASQLALTVANTDATNNGDLRDSDATSVSGVPTIAVRTGTAGDNNHTYDVGFSVTPNGTTTTSTSTTSTTSTTTSTTPGTTTTTTFTASTTTTTTPIVGGKEVSRPTALPFTGSSSTTIIIAGLSLIITGLVFVWAKGRKVRNFY